MAIDQQPARARTMMVLATWNTATKTIPSISPKHALGEAVGHWARGDADTL
jgi:hypothetical protein